MSIVLVLAVALAGSPPPPTPKPAAAQAPSGYTYTSKPEPAPTRAPALTPAPALTFVKVPAGEFLMGCAQSDEECDEDERPAHKVKISRAFEVATTEATVGQFRAFCRAEKREMPEQPDGSTDAAPVVNVTHEEAGAFCRWSGGGRLPTEAEWEYAARAGETRAYYGDLSAVAVYGTFAPAPVASKKPNAWGLYDVLGNAWEWCADGYSATFYERTPDVDPLWEKGQSKVLRGGGYLSPYGSLRLSARFRMLPDGRAPYAGIRCARDVAR